MRMVIPECACVSYPSGRNFIRKISKDEELKEKTIGGGTRSQPDIRYGEALRQLELEGLVTIIPNRGAFVEGISKDDIQDIYEIRSLLEGLCAKKAVTGITEKRIRRIRGESLSYGVSYPKRTL